MQLQGAFEANLEPDIIAMNLHGARADVEFLGRVVTRVPLGHQDHYFQLPVGQVVNMRVMILVRMVHDGTDRLMGELLIQIQVPANHRFHRALKFSHRIHFVEIPHRASPQTALRIKILAMQGMHQNLEIGI